MLTAAHCVNGYKSASKAKLLRIHAGDYDLSKNDPGEQIMKVCRVVVHSGYGNNLNDVALLKLCSPVKTSNKAKVIRMASTSFKVPKSSYLGVAGWGRTTEGGDSSDRLKKVFVKKVEFGDCKKSYSSINKGNICAGMEKGGKDSCQGDSGGPLWYKKNKVTTLVGVVSWGRGCARPGKPGVYAKVAYYRNWINNVIGAKDDVEEYGKIAENSSSDSEN